MIAEAVATTKKSKPRGKKQAYRRVEVTRWETLSEDAKELVNAIESAETQIVDLQEQVAMQLRQLVDLLGGKHSFEHPDRGEITIMARKDGKIHWRPKPKGPTKADAGEPEEEAVEEEPAQEDAA